MKNVPSSKINFTTLISIMERYKSVPYEQFQEELQSWFECGLAEKITSHKKDELITSFDLNELSELISKIYHFSEVSQTLADAKIHPVYGAH